MFPQLPPSYLSFAYIPWTAVTVCAAPKRSSSSPKRTIPSKSSSCDEAQNVSTAYYSNG